MSDDKKKPGRQAEELPEITTNLTTLKREIKNAVGEIEAAAVRRQGANEDKAAIITKLEAKGINRHALKMMIRYLGFDDRQRKNFDESMMLVREAVGAPIQSDLFDKPDLKEPESADVDFGENQPAVTH